MIRIRAGAASDVGQVRQVNQDTILVDERLFVVADGMGGHRGGEIASEIAVTTLRSALTTWTADALAEAVQDANRAVVDYAEDDPSVKGMGTTVCALALVEDDGEERIAIVNVGDSRCYLAKREGGIEQQTEDHSLVATLERQGQLTAEEAAVHPHRNILTRALGIDEHVLVDLFEIRPFAGDRYLICSDGLFNEVGEDDIDAVLRRLDDPGEVAAELVRLANEGGGRDNISVVVVDVLPDAEHPADGSTEGRLAKVVHAEEPLAEEIRRAGPGGSAEPAPGPAAVVDAGPVARGGAPASDPPTAETAVAADGGPPASGPRTRFTWRVAVFLFVLVAVAVAAAGIVTYYARSAYLVRLEGDELVVYKGRDVLFLSKELDERCGIGADQIEAAQVRRLESGIEKSSAAEARQLILNSVVDPEADEVVTSPCLLAEGETPPTTSSTTTSSTTTSSTTTTVADSTTTSVSVVIDSTVVTAPSGG